MPELIPAPAPSPVEMSLFESATRPVPKEKITVEQLVELVRNPPPSLLQSLNEARGALAAGDTAAYAALKRSLPAASFAGVFRQRRNDSLETHSGLMPIDIDHLDAAALASARESLRQDPHCVFLYVSPSGAGLKGAIRLSSAPADDPQHKRAFAAVSRYLQETHGLALDAACKDVARLAFLSSDPECHHHPAALGLDVNAWTETPDTSYIPHQTSNIPAAAGGEDFVLHGDNDAGRAARFVDRWRDEIRYVTDRGVWLVWDGRWKLDRAGGVVRRAITLANEIYAEAAARPAPSAPQTASTPNGSNGSNGEEELKRRAAQLQHAARWGNRRIIESNVDLARADASIQCAQADLDSDPWLLGTPNAVVNLRTGEAFEHSPEHLVTMVTRAHFDPEARAPRWERFIEEIYPDPALRHYVWKTAGYAITGHTGEKSFHFLMGTGNNGKSKFCEAIEYVAGDYAGHAAKGLLCATDKGQYPLREAATIVGKRIIIGPETEARERLNVAILKVLTGHGDTMRAAALYENQFDFIPVGKLFIMGNHKPSISDTGPAIWNRIRLIPHDTIFAAHEQDKSLGEKLRAEASGILNWLIQGALLWQDEGLEPPDKVRTAVEQYRSEEDTLGEFIEDCVEPDPDNLVPHATVYSNYTRWAESSGIRYPLTKRALAKALREKGWQQVATRETRTAWEGIILL